MNAKPPARRDDFVEEATIRRFVGNVEPGDHISTAIVLWSVAISLALAIGSTLWWVSTH